MTAPIVETPVETPEAPPVVAEVDTQSNWEKFTPEMRGAALRGDDLEPAGTPTEPPKETPPVEEPPKETPTEPPAKAEEPPETPPPEEPAKPVEEPPAEPPKEEPKKLFAGQYETVEAMEAAVLEKQGVIDRQGGELGELRKQPQPKPEPEPEDPEPVRDQFDETSLKAHDEWFLREVDRRNKASETRIAQGLSQYEMAQPVRDMIKQFTDDHKDISPEKRLTIGQHADNMARAAGKPVSLEEAYADLFGAITETPSKPEEPSKGKETAEAIAAASAVPKTVSDVPTSPPAEVSEIGGEAESQAAWDAKTEAQRLKALRDIPDAPKG